MRVNQGQEFVIGGYTASAKNFDALIFASVITSNPAIRDHPKSGHMNLGPGASLLFARLPAIAGGPRFLPSPVSQS